MLQEQEGPAMMISTKGRYALRIMIDLAQNGNGNWTSLTDIAKRQEVSVKYLEAVIAMLNRSGILESKMGKNGGYRLAKTLDQCSIGEILRAAEGGLSPVSCLDCEEVSCEKADDCITLPMWRELDRLINGYLNQVSLADLLSGRVQVRR